MIRPKHSVIIPVHNGGRYVRRAISSVLRQRSEDFELILIDDGSTDDSLECMYEFTDKRIRIFSRESCGPGAGPARNFGLSLARGEWISFLDADDEWCENRLSTVDTLIQKYLSDIYATGWYVSRGHTKTLCQFSIRFNKEKIKKIDFNDFLSLSANGMPPIHTNVITIRRSLVLSVGGFPTDTVRGEDIVAWLKVVNSADVVVCSSLPMAYYHQERVSLTQTFPPQVQGNIIFWTCKKMLREANGYSRKFFLKRYSNHYLKHGLVYRAAEGTLSQKDCSYFFWEGNPITYLFFRFFSLFPPRTQRFLWSLYRSLK